MKPNSSDTLFKENREEHLLPRLDQSFTKFSIVSGLDIEIVGTETIVCTTQDGSVINNISITFSSANGEIILRHGNFLELANMYFSFRAFPDLPSVTRYHQRMGCTPTKKDK